MPPNRFESEVGNFLEGSHGDRTHIKRADHHTVTPLCGTLLPLAWGKPRIQSRISFDIRIIPAHAGKTSWWIADKSCANGLIPAHAGKTYSPAEPPRRERAHPHSRRENTLGGNGALNNAGSSPLTRGNRKPEQAVKYSWGSSPLTRGKRGRPRCKHPRTGLIPAHAGKTARRRRTLRSRRAHPRSRRENTSWRVPAMPLKGPSPLTRGKLVEQPSLLSVLRLIPAHAGKTAYPASS